MTTVNMTTINVDRLSCKTLHLRASPPRRPSPTTCSYPGLWRCSGALVSGGGGEGSKHDARSRSCSSSSITLPPAESAAVTSRVTGVVKSPSNHLVSASITSTLKPAVRARFLLGEGNHCVRCSIHNQRFMLPQTETYLALRQSTCKLISYTYIVEILHRTQWLDRRDGALRDVQSPYV